MLNPAAPAKGQCRDSVVSSDKDCARGAKAWVSFWLQMGRRHTACGCVHAQLGQTLWWYHSRLFLLSNCFWKSSPEDMCVDFREREGKRERQRETLTCVPWPGIKPTTRWCTGRCSNQQSHPAGLLNYWYFSVGWACTSPCISLSLSQHTHTHTHTHTWIRHIFWLYLSL